MFASPAVVALGLLLVGADPARSGVIRGAVVNASASDAPVPGAEVVLRIAYDGETVPFRTTKSDEQGRFVFDDLPVREFAHFLPGASYDGIHYPGARLQLTSMRPEAEVRLSVREAAVEPNPLIVRRMEIDLRHEPGLLVVTESLLIDNPTSRCYVGRPEGEEERPVTLRLAIPADFVRCTFDKEFFGRRFYAVENVLLTDVPWQPGQRELKYTYRVPNESRSRVWQRPLDLPCEQVVLTVHSDPSEVACNLDGTTEERPDGVTFQSSGSPLPTGHVLAVELGRLPVSWIAYGRWGALTLVLGIAVASTFVIVRKRGVPAFSAIERRRRP